MVNRGEPARANLTITISARGLLVGSFAKVLVGRGRTGPGGAMTCGTGVLDGELLRGLKVDEPLVKQQSSCPWETTRAEASAEEVVGQLGEN